MRALAFVLAGIVLGGGVAAAEDRAAQRAHVRQAMHAGYAEAGPGLPNLPDLLFDRFPADMDAFVDKAIDAKGGRPSAEAKSDIAAILVAIQTRDGERLRAAPKADLMAVVQAQGDIVRIVAQEDPALCKVLAGGGSAQAAPSPAIGNAFVTRLYRLLAAIADGRDRPAGDRAPQPDDYRQFALAARARGVDIKTWEVLAPDRIGAATTDQICTALASSYGAALAIDGALGERILADMAADLLVKDAATYQPALAR